MSEWNKLCQWMCSSLTNRGGGVRGAITASLFKVQLYVQRRNVHIKTSPDTSFIQFMLYIVFHKNVT